MSRGRIQLSQTIRAPARTIFAFLTDLDRTPAWDQRVTKVTQMTRGPLRLGVILRSTLVMDGQTFHLDDEVTEFEPPTRFGLRAVLGGTDAVTYTLSEDETGQTRVDVVLSYDLPDATGGAAPDAEGLRQAIAQAMTHSLGVLKGLIEGEASPPA
jgi:uncharacterized membrane protein